MVQNNVQRRFKPLFSRHKMQAFLPGKGRKMQKKMQHSSKKCRIAQNAKLSPDPSQRYSRLPSARSLHERVSYLQPEPAAFVGNPSRVPVVDCRLFLHTKVLNLINRANRVNRSIRFNRFGLLLNRPNHLNRSIPPRVGRFGSPRPGRPVDVFWPGRAGRDFFGLDRAAPSRRFCRWPDLEKSLYSLLS